MGKQDAASPASTEDNPDVLEKRMCKNMYAAALLSSIRLPSTILVLPAGLLSIKDCACSAIPIYSLRYHLVCTPSLELFKSFGLGSGLPTALPVAGFPEFPSFYMSSFLVYSCPLCYDAIASMASPPLSWWCGLYYQPCRLSGTSSSLEPYEHRL